MGVKLDRIISDSHIQSNLGSPNLYGFVVNAITSNYNVTIFKGEENFKKEITQKWFQETLVSSFYIVGIYLMVIFGGKQLMKRNEKFDLKKLLILWNFGLAAFSFLGAMRVIPELLHSLLQEKNGFYHSVCLEGYSDNKVLAYWNVLFVLSKVIELGDTVFIVLRKQPLIFLHWYHHVTVLVFSWSTAADSSAPSRWYSSLNFFIHSLMYTYYGLRALKIHIPKKVALAITFSQLLQMVVGIFTITAAYLYKNNGHRCEVSDTNIYAGMAIYASYWILFAHFFYNAYCVPSPSSNKRVNESRKKM